MCIRDSTYPHQIEVITSEQMMDAYSSVGMPINYPHWSFGKKFIETEQAYKDVYKRQAPIEILRSGFFSSLTDGSPRHPIRR